MGDAVTTGVLVKVNPKLTVTVPLLEPDVVPLAMPLMFAVLFNFKVLTVTDAPVIAPVTPNELVDAAPVTDSVPRVADAPVIEPVTPNELVDAVPVTESVPRVADGAATAPLKMNPLTSLVEFMMKFMAPLESEQ